MNPEGWYEDPYGVHDERWYSDGAPTALVRDGRHELNDPPPATAPPRPLVRASHSEHSGPDDLLRV
jgi:hypothetical protein